MTTQQQQSRIATGDRVRVAVSGRTGTVERAFDRAPDFAPQARVQMDGDSPDRTIVYLAADLERIDND